MRKKEGKRREEKRTICQNSAGDLNRIMSENGESEGLNPGSPKKRVTSESLMDFFFFFYGQPLLRAKIYPLSFVFITVLSALTATLWCFCVILA